MRDGMITEEQCGENFAYILEDKTDFLITEYKMMHGQEADFLLKCVKMLYNGKTELYYDTKSCLPLAIQSGAEDTEGMLSVLGNILHEVRRVTENGFLSLLKLDISADKIWVDPATRKIRFVYLPVAERLHKDVVEFEEHLRGELKKTVEKRSDKDDKRFADFFQIIGRPGYSSEDSDVEKCGSVDETSTPYSLNRNEKVSSQRGDQTCTLLLFLEFYIFFFICLLFKPLLKFQSPRLIRKFQCVFFPINILKCYIINFSSCMICSFRFLTAANNPFYVTSMFKNKSTSVANQIPISFPFWKMMICPLFPKNPNLMLLFPRLK